MTIAFRPAAPADFDYSAKLYFAAMEATIRALELDIDKHAKGLRERWIVDETRIIPRDGADIGWLQAATEGDALFLKQLFVAAARKRRGTGTQVMRHLSEEAAHAGRAMTLGAVKTNPALGLY